MKSIAEFYKVSYEEFEKSIEKFAIDNSISKLSDDMTRGLYNNIKLPKRSTTGSAGYDFFAPFAFDIINNDTILIPTGIRVKIDNGWVLKLYPRSSLGFKYGIHLMNTVGIIDSDYYHSDNEGHIFVKLFNPFKDSVIIRKHDKFAQGVFVQYGVTINDNVTDIRNGGFGSTDKKDENSCIEDIKYDVNNNCIYRKDNEKEYFYKYDDNKNIIFYREVVNGTTVLRYDEEFDSNNNSIHYKDNKGFECWRKYNIDSRIVFYFDNKGNVQYYEYYDDKFKITTSYKYRSNIIVKYENYSIENIKKFDLTNKDLYNK